MQPVHKLYFPALTGFRALAAYLVFFHHANPFSDHGWQRPLHSFVHEFHVGVSLFFVLSGLLIYLRYSEDAQSKQRWLSDYLQNRFARIYPLYFILTTITFIVLIAANEYTFDKKTILIYLSNITFLKGFFNDLKFTGIAQGWSLTVEECFYLLMPFVLFWLRKYKLILLPAIGVSMGSLLVLSVGQLKWFGLFSDFHFMMVYTFFGRCFEFFIGVGLAIIMKNRVANKGHTYYTFGGIISLIVLIGLMAWISKEGESGIDQPAGLIINNFFVPVATSFLIFGLITEKTIIQKILSTPLLELLGKSSFAFYLIHAGIFYAFTYRYISHHPLIIFLFLNMIAVGVYYAIEKPQHQKWKVKI